VIKKFRPSRWISSIATVWGIIATLTGLCNNYGSLIACRLLLGLVEGGLFPGMAIYLTLFYTKRELALRIAYLFVSAALAGATGGLLAYAIGFMDGTAGLRGWRWIMIIEGLPTFVLGIATFFILADDPAHAYYLTPAEKALMIVRQNRQAGQTTSAQKFHRQDVRHGLTDWKVYAFCVGQFGADAMLYGYSTFLPTIIKTFGHWTNAQVQALTIPCYVLGAVTYLLVARLSDRQQLRGLYCVVFGTVSVVGYAILLADVGPGAHYFGCFVIALGLYVVVGLPLAWLPANCPRYGKRTTAGGLQLMIGNTSGIMAPFVSLLPSHSSCLAPNHTYPIKPPMSSSHPLSLSPRQQAKLTCYRDSCTRPRRAPATSKATPSRSPWSATRPCCMAACRCISAGSMRAGREATRMARCRA